MQGTFESKNIYNMERGDEEEAMEAYIISTSKDTHEWVPDEGNKVI
jgi:hypothetical protein